jgi:hypothetical protein
LAASAIGLPVIGARGCGGSAGSSSTWASTMPRGWPMSRS